MTLTEDQIWALHLEWEKEYKPCLVRPFDDEDAKKGVGWRYYLENDNDRGLLIPALVMTLERYEEKNDYTVIYCDVMEVKDFMDWELTNQTRTIPEMPFEKIELRSVGKSMLRQIWQFQRHEDSLLMEMWQYDEFFNQDIGDYHKLIEWRGYADLLFKNGTISLTQECSSFNNIYHRTADYKEGHHDDNINDIVDKLYKVDPSDKQSKQNCTNEAVMAYQILCGLCNHINNMKPKIASPVQRKLSDIGNKEFIARQKVLAKKCKMLQGGNTKTVATGEGTKHSYRYEVRGHWRNTDSGVIWVNPHKRGEGEEDKSPYVTTETVKETVKANNYFLDQILVKLNQGKGIVKHIRKAMSWLVTLFRKEITLTRK